MGPVAHVKRPPAGQLGDELEDLVNGVLFAGFRRRHRGIVECSRSVRRRPSWKKFHGALQSGSDIGSALRQVS